MGREAERQTHASRSHPAPGRDRAEGEEVTTADWALVISILSAAISLSGFIWNVWSKFIYPKPKLQVRFSMVRIIEQHADDAGDLQVLTLSATNMGPVEITLKKALIVFRRSWLKEKSYGILNVLPRAPTSSDYEYEYELGGGPFAGGFPKKLAVGEGFSVYLVPDHETLARGDYQRIGFDDSFGREHWAPRRDVLVTLPYIREACEKSGKVWRSRK
jgi:hypothetical protein